MRFSTCFLSAALACVAQSATSCSGSGNNCQRAIRDAKVSSSASAFCATYTTTLNTDKAAIPTYLANCNKSPSSVSSACSCLMTSTSTPSTPTPPPYPPCDFSQSGGGHLAQGGCSSSCYCNADVDNTHAYCGSTCGAGHCGDSCTSDAQCGPGEFCDIFDPNPGASGTCYSSSGCTSSYIPSKRSLFGQGRIMLKAKAVDGTYVGGDKNRG